MRQPKNHKSCQIDLVPDEDGGFTVVVPSLPGCISYGATVEAATRHARAAITLHLENLAAHREPNPDSRL
jgi:antitoxin HicB